MYIMKLKPALKDNIWGGAKLKNDYNFKTDLKNLLTKNDLQNAIDVLNKNYGAFELGQKIEEPKKEEV